MKHKYLLFFIIIIFSFLLSKNIMAHKVNLFAELDGDLITVESFYSAGEMINNGDIKVYDSQNNKVLYEGKTDAKGVLKFSIPTEALNSKVGLRIVLYVGMGHKAEWEITYQELKISLKAYNDKSGKLIQKQVADNKIKKTAVVNASKISVFHVIAGLIIIWIAYGVIHFIKKNKKRTT